MYQCVICGKKRVIGHTITKRGMAKKDGGVGRRNVRVNSRRFLPNLQRITLLRGGVVSRSLVCTGCLRSGRAVKAPMRSASPAAAA
jgi:large subunit ribosomal protein L28